MDTLSLNPELLENHQNILNSIPLNIFFKDTENNVLQVNRAAALLLGGSEHEFKHRPLSGIFPKESDELFEKDLEVLQTGEPTSGSVESVTLPDGRKIRLKVDRTPSKDENGTVVGVVVFASDITEQYEIEKKLRRSESLLSRTEHIARLGGWDWEAKNNRVRWSDEMYRVLGLEPGDEAELTYKFFESRVHPDDRKTIRASRSKALKTGIFESYQFRTIPINGETRIIQAHGEVFLDGSGKVMSIAGIDQDITDFHKVETELKNTLTELQRSNDELTEFAYIASHDLKAPLRAIDNISRWLEEDLGDDLPAESKGHIVLMRQRVERMERLLNDLLAYARFEGDWADIEEVDVEEMVKNIPGTLASTKEIELDLIDLPFLTTSIVPFEQVFMNLIENAAKHHDKDSVKMRISCSDQGGRFEFVVEDDGPGIPPEHRDRVQRMFQTLKPRDEVEGSGMGLAFVKKIIEHLGGKVLLESADPNGCRVRFTWPKTIV